MRHLKKGRKFSMKAAPRKALLISLASEIVLRGKIKTTHAKAKEVSSYLEKFLTKAKKGDLASRRMINRYFSKKTTKKMIEEIAPKIQTRKGGYTRVIKLGPRKGDGAKMAVIELVK